MRGTYAINDKNLLPFFAGKQRVEAASSAFPGRLVVVPLPKITNVLYGRDVSSTAESIMLVKQPSQFSQRKCGRSA